MIDLYFAPSPNTWKISIALEECELPYRIRPINLGENHQKEPAYLAINPNGRVPAIVDPDGPDGPFSVFESGAILIYIADKTGKLLSDAPLQRSRALQWLFWQIGGPGPMAGQSHVFRNQARDDLAYAVDRYTGETTRLYGVLNDHLAEHEFLADTYSIADIACWPWIFFHRMHGQDLTRFPHIARWYEIIGQRPAVRRGRAAGLELAPPDYRESLQAESWSPSAI